MNPYPNGWFVPATAIMERRGEVGFILRWRDPAASERPYEGLAKGLTKTSAPGV